MGLEEGKGVAFLLVSLLLGWSIFLMNGVTMEYVVGVLFGLALLVGLLLLRRQSRRSAHRPHLSFHPHTDEAGEIMCFAMGPGRSSSDKPLP